MQDRYRMIKRTEGVSSTDIVGRMLMCTRDNARFREACLLLSLLRLARHHTQSTAGLAAVSLTCAQSHK